MSTLKLPAKFLIVNVEADTMKVCEATKKKDVVSVLNAFTLKTPDFSFEDGVIKDLPNIVKALHEALRANNIKTKEVIFSISSTKVITKEVTIPYISSRDKILSLIAANAGEYFPVATDDCVYSYSVLDVFDMEIDGKPQKHMRFMAYAVVNEIVNSRYELAAQLGLKVVNVDYTGNSIVQVCKRQVGEPTTMAIVYNDSSTVINIFKNGSLKLQRTASNGANYIIEAVSGAYGLNREGAVELLSKMSIREIMASKESVKEAADEYFNSVQRIKEYYRSRFPDSPVADACLMGTGSVFVEIEKAFSEYLGVTTRKLETLNCVECAFAEAPEVLPEGGTSVPVVRGANELLRYIEVIGAAFEPLTLVSKELEGDYLAKSRNAIYRIIILVSVLIALVLVAIPFMEYMSLSGDKSDVKDKIEEADKRIENEKVAEIMAQYNDALAKLTDINELEEKTVNAANYTYDFIRVLEIVRPTRCTIQSFSCGDGGAISMSVEADSKETVAKFIMQLKTICNVTDEISSSLTESDDDREGAAADGTEGKRVYITFSCTLSPGFITAEPAE